MRRRIILIGCFLFVLAFTSCEDSLKPKLSASPASVTLSSSSIIETISSPTSTPPTTATPSVTWPSSENEPVTEETTPPKHQYTITATLDYGQQHLSVEQEIIYTNSSSDGLFELYLMVEPNHFPWAFHLGEPVWGNGQPIEDYALVGLQLRIPLKEMLLPGQHVKLFLSYEFDIPERSGSLGYTSLQTNLGDWYPFIPAYKSGSGWLAKQPWNEGEYLVYDLVDYRVNIRLTGTQKELIIAASAPAQVEGDWFRFYHENARSFAWSVGTSYQVAQTTVDSVTVLSYFYPEHRQAGEAALEAVAQSLDLYNELFGMYPRKMFTIVEASFPDGMEYDGIVYVSQGFYHNYDQTPKNNMTTLAVHETAHQWWYASVGSDPALEPWLDEALCVYSELLFYERVYPHLIDWWWYFRVGAYYPQGWMNETIYDFDAFRPYVNAVYLRGALFMGELRSLVGEEAFFAFIKNYAASYKRSFAYGEDFFDILSKHSQADLSPLLAKYFNSK